jgi:hypothetical protein
VIYCKFWELDTDHDFFIDKENLIKYGNHALTYRIVDRIFSEVGILFVLPVSVCSSFFSFVVFFCMRRFFKINFILTISKIMHNRFLGNLPAKLPEKCVTKILFILFCQKRTNHQNRAKIIGRSIKHLHLHYVCSL